MRSRWLSTFTIIGVGLIVLGVIGLVSRHFVYDPGQVPDGKEPWYYLVVGALMIVNGIFTPPSVVDDKDDAASTNDVKSSVAN